MLLEKSINSSIQDKDLVGKRDGYKKSKVKFVEIFAYTENYLDFSKRIIKDRDSELKEYFVKLFSILDS